MRLKLQLAGTGLLFGVLSLAFFSIRNMNAPLSQPYAVLDFFGTLSIILAIVLIGTMVLIAQLGEE